MAASPKGTNYRSSLALIYEFKGERLKRLREYRQALSYYQRSMDLAASVVAESPIDYSSRNQILSAEGGICGLLAILNERAASLGVASKMIASAKDLAVSRPDVISRAYVAKTMAWAGDSYVASEGGKRRSLRSSEPRIGYRALTYYRQSAKPGRSFWKWKLGPYRGELGLCKAAATSPNAVTRLN